ncbi:hypothetical protein HPP92_010346 [Vanilla planifolia]|uniref:Pectinesterase inhibitor domain-containing protein n=1 Tax=Vanilla planifolia TaxID=51239 RepID=A0A835QX01_VANPL|nr:hypothetical protein HPP92_010346 [Vanilla planifolia]
MTTTASATLVPLLSTVLLLLLFQRCHGDLAFLTSQCQQTHYFDYCMAAMQTDSRSIIVKTTAEILSVSIDIAIRRTTVVVRLMVDKARRSPGGREANALNRCAQIYSSAIANLRNARNEAGRENYGAVYDRVKEGSAAPGKCDAALAFVNVPLRAKNDDERNLFGVVLDFADLMNES